MSVDTTFEFKVVVAGPFSSGKTTLIKAISDTPVVGTEAPTSGDEAAVKATTTVGMEYGTFQTGGDGLEVTLHLYGVPGQRRFQFMWDIVSEGMDGLIVLIDATEPDTWTEAAAVGRHFHDRLRPPTVVAANRAVGDQALVARLADAVPIADAIVVPCDVTDPTSARDVLVDLLLLLLEQMPEDEIAV